MTVAFSQHKQREEELVAAIEALRIEKDTNIRLITREREESRVSFETRINELDRLAKT
jgi:chromosome segregation ATPase